MLTRNNCGGVLLAVLLAAGSLWAADVPVLNGDFETVTEAGKPAGWVYTGVAEDFGSTVFPAGSDNHVGWLADGQLIYQTIEGFTFEMDHRLTISFDVVKEAQSGPSTLLIQILTVDENGMLDYAGEMDDCAVEFEVFGGSFARQSVSINIDDEAVAGKSLRVRFYASIQNEGKKIYLDNVTVEDTLPLVGDINYDGVVNWDDLDILLANWGLCNWVPAVLCPVIPPVPEDLLPERP